MSAALMVGAATRDISPNHPVHLAGFAVRNRPHEAIDQPLALTATWFILGENHALLVVADMLWWPPERSDLVRAAIAIRWGMPMTHVVLHATHTHGAPHASIAFPNALGAFDAAWIETLMETLNEVINAAWANRKPATLERARGSSQIGINRRVQRGNDPGEGDDGLGPIDREVIVIRARGDDDSTIALLVHHACHPTTTQLHRVTADFPGVMARLIGEETGAVTTFLQGTCGDINPRPTIERDIRELNDDDVLALGEELAIDVRAAMESGWEPLPVTGIHGESITIEMPYQAVPTPDHLVTLTDREGIDGEWSRLLLEQPERLVPAKPLSLTRLSIGDQFGLLAIDAEVTTAYGTHIKQRSDGTMLPLPYSNGMTCYLVTATQLANGGYEARESTQYFGLPSPLAPDVEAIVTQAIDELIPHRSIEDTTA